MCIRDSDLANAITEDDLKNVIPVEVEEFKAARDKANAVYNDASLSLIHI